MNGILAKILVQRTGLALIEAFLSIFVAAI